MARNQQEEFARSFERSEKTSQIQNYCHKKHLRDPRRNSSHDLNFQENLLKLHYIIKPEIDLGSLVQSKTLTNMQKKSEDTFQNLSKSQPKHGGRMKRLNILNYRSADYSDVLKEIYSENAFL